MVQTLLFVLARRVLVRAALVAVTVILALVFRTAGFGMKPLLLDSPPKPPAGFVPANSTLVLLQPAAQSGWVILEVRSYPLAAPLNPPSHAPAH
jgi:hypothetical protein